MAFTLNVYIQIVTQRFTGALPLSSSNEYASAYLISLVVMITNYDSQSVEIVIY